MRVDEPRWWYDAARSPTARLLQPFGWLTAQIAAHRWRTAKPYCAKLKVVCIGNFTAGGTGKTPLAIEVAAMLRALGEKPVFLSRGYGGSKRGPHRVSPATDSAAIVGDEPLLLARAAPTYIARDRAAGAKAMEADVAGGRLEATVMIMDDGLQNPALAKDLTLAVVDGRRGFGNGHVLPAGPLRAPLAMQMTRVDAIIVNGHGPISSELSQYFAGPILQTAVKAATDVAWIKARPLVAFAGIGNPRRFFDLVRSLGGEVAAEMSFADHQPLSEADAVRILATAHAHGADIITTEKDFVRLNGATGNRARLLAAAKALPIKLVLPIADRARLDAMLTIALELKRGH